MLYRVRSRSGPLPIALPYQFVQGHAQKGHFARWPQPDMKTIFFDLDGTLTDPKIGITRSIRYALERLGREPPSENELTWCIGPPLHASFVKLLG